MRNKNQKLFFFCSILFILFKRIFIKIHEFYNTISITINVANVPVSAKLTYSQFTSEQFHKIRNSPLPLYTNKNCK